MTILSPLGFLYGKIADARNALYERGVLRSYSLGAKTISIGNITAGGTGKTPLVAHVAEILAESGEKVCILTRGYGRENPRDRVLVSDGEQVLADAKKGGDEPVELARKLIGKAIIVADADRVSAAAWAKEKFGVTAFVLDDGFQHRRVKRDVDIVCVDAMNPFGRKSMLPAGTLREPIENISRAGAVVITRANLVENVTEISEEIRTHAPQTTVFVCNSKIVRIVPLNDFTGERSVQDSTERLTPDLKALRSLGEFDGDDEVRCLAFCALGNPESFFIQLMELFDREEMNEEFDLSIVRSFPDHHFYTQADIADLDRRTGGPEIHAFLTTAKDAVKLQGLKFKIPCFVVEVTMEIDDSDGFRQMITSSGNRSA